MGCPDITQVRAAISERQEGDDEVFRYVVLDHVSIEKNRMELLGPFGKVGPGADVIVIPLAVPGHRSDIDRNPLYRFGEYLNREFGAPVVIRPAETGGTRS